MQVFLLSIVIPACAMASDVRLSLLGTTEPFATREILVGPGTPICRTCEKLTVIDADQTIGLDDRINLPSQGGEINVFLYAEVFEPSAGLMSMVVDLLATPDDLILSEPKFDVVFRDVPGRTLTTESTTLDIPLDRPISGPLSLTELGTFRQAWTSIFSSESGLPFELGWRDISAGGFSAVATPDLHTFGIGQTGNDQSGGPTALLRFTVTVPPLPDDVTGRTYGIAPRVRSLLTFIERPMFSTPIVPAYETIEPGQFLSPRKLGIAVGDAPAGLGDCDVDGDVDLVDFGQFRLCFTGPGGSAGANCACHQYDDDEDVDLVDLAEYQLHYTGAGFSGSIAPPDPTTATVKGDSDSDGDTDFVDMAWFELCFSGPGGGLSMPGCENMDYDDDSDVDNVDLDQFKLDFTGPQLP